MQRTQYVEAKKTALAAMSTENLAIAIGEYFDRHKTMPGEKDLKAAAEKIIANMAENPEFDIPAETKEQIVDQFANISVREMKVENLQVKNVTKQNKDDASVLKASDIGLVETGSVSGEGNQPTKTFYEVVGRIEGDKVMVGDYEIGSLGKGFAVNNPGVSCEATVIATDYSNGKLSNVSYTVIADIAA